MSNLTHTPSNTDTDIPDVPTIQPITAADTPITIPITHSNLSRIDQARLLNSIEQIPNADKIIHAISTGSTNNPRSLAISTGLPIETIKQTLALMREEIAKSGLL